MLAEMEKTNNWSRSYKWKYWSKQSNYNDVSKCIDMDTCLKILFEDFVWKQAFLGKFESSLNCVLNRKSYRRIGFTGVGTFKFPEGSIQKRI